MRCDYAYAKLTPFSYVSALHISKISSSQSNTLGYRADIQPGDDMNDLLTIGVYRIQSGSYAAQISNLPSDYGHKAGVCAVIHTLQLLASYGDTSSTFSALWMRDNYMSGSERRWTEWVKVAIAAPPQEFDLPLESAFQNFLQERSVYRKDQFGVVNLDISVQPVFEIAVDTVIAYLPEGFRPAKNKRAAAIAVTPENECIAFPLFVGTSGMVSIAFFSAQPAQYKAIIGQIEFVADG